jgi:hypothetical protein
MGVRGAKGQGIMTRCLSGLRIAILAAGAVLSSTAVHAFTLEGDAGNAGAPKFDIEEQSRNFRTGDSDMSAIGKSAVDTPFGKLQFGVQRETPMFGSAFGSNSAIEDRRHFNRMLAPPTSLERYQ